MSSATGDRERDDDPGSDPPTPLPSGSAAAPASAAAGPADAAASAGKIVGESELLSGIERLKAEQKVLRAERKRVARDLKNMEKTKSRLNKRARQLSDADLLQVLAMRSGASPKKSSSGEAAGANAVGEGGDGPEGGAVARVDG